jgi:hypothetical protein
LLAATLLIAPSVAWGDDATPAAKQVAQLLSGTANADRATGTLESFPAEYRVDHAGKYHDQTSTILRLKIPVQDFQLNLHRHSPWDDDERRAGRLVDVEVNDAAFDEAFVVAGAPSDLLRALLDPPVRGAMMESQKVSVSVDGTFLQLDKDGPIATAEEAQKFVALATLFAAHIRAGVRPAPGTALSPEAAAKERADLQAKLSSRQQANAGMIVVFGMVGVVVIGGMIFNIRRRAAAAAARTRQR